MFPLDYELFNAEYADGLYLALLWLLRLPYEAWMLLFCMVVYALALRMYLRRGAVEDGEDAKCR